MLWTPALSRKSFTTAQEAFSREYRRPGCRLMAWIGALIGWLVGRWQGAVIGFIVGLVVSRLFARTLVSAVRSRFLDATWAVMGAMAKADGRVSPEEIRVAEALFDRMGLTGEHRQAAQAAFNRGKSPGFEIDIEVEHVKRACRAVPPLLQMFLQVQLAALSADGVVHAEEHKLLVRIARGLGLSDAEVDRLESMLRVHGKSAASKLDDAYKVLGVDASATDDDVKRAYRKLMSENHPDKLAARGLPESMRAMAEERSRDITTAYDVVKEARGMS
jgi:DnaJ like chaperone protein